MNDAAAHVEANQVITLDVKDGIATMTMARPKQRNPFTPEFKERIAALMLEIQSRNDIDVLILTGSGGVFSAGGDIKSMVARAQGD
ncbi:MAG: enoyl-CoA hydratase/isomerase family protein, partial [Pseudomonadota bacterium]